MSSRRASVRFSYLDRLLSGRIVARGTRSRLILALPLVAVLVVTGCGVLGSNSNGIVCPAPTLEPVTPPGGAGGAVTYGFLIGRADAAEGAAQPARMQ